MMKKGLIFLFGWVALMSACSQLNNELSEEHNNETAEQSIAEGAQVGAAPEQADEHHVNHRLGQTELGVELIRVEAQEDVLRRAQKSSSPRSKAFSTQNSIDHHSLVATHERVNTENYLATDQNSQKLVSEDPVSTFSVDVDTAAYSNIRRMIMHEGRLPPKDAVKVEELINYFNYDYAVSDSRQEPFTVAVELAPAPWSEKHQLMQIGIKGYEPPLEDRPAANLVFLVDVSGSMRSANKLGLVKKSLGLLVNQMKANDTIALVVYAGAAGIVLDATSGDMKSEIRYAIDSLEAGGSTNGGAGIELAYRIAEKNFVKGGINRVLVASDGDLNVGTVSLEALKEMVETRRKSGIAFSTLGFGSGNYNYALMEQLADIGNGHAAYIDTLREAYKVLVEEMQSTLLTIAKDVKIQVEFNPAVVKEYRLLGYESRLLNREDFTNDKVDAGDIGAGHTVTALYELVLVGSGSGLIPDLRYQKPSLISNEASGEIAFIKLRYKQPHESSSQEVSIPVGLSNQKTASNDLRFAAAVAGFGQILQGGIYTGDWGLDDALLLASGAKGEDKHGYRAELINLVQLAKNLSIQPGD